jgi:hypothetical protein
VCWPLQLPDPGPAKLLLLWSAMQTQHEVGGM